MAMMNIPGFTAEDALYLSKAHYRLIARGVSATKANIRPQQATCPGGYGPCAGYCNPVNRPGFDCDPGYRPCYTRDRECYCVQFPECQ
jgi:hypothetical protein